MGSSRRIPFLSTHQSSPKSAHPGATQSARNPLSACVYPHSQGDSLGIKQAGWGASGAGGLAMGQGPLSLTVASCHTNYGTLLSPFSMARSPNKPSPPPYARSRTRRVLHPVPAQRASSCPRGPPPPTPPILLANLPEAKRGNTRNIIRGSTIRVRPQGPASGPLTQANPFLHTPPLAARRCAAFSGESSRLHLRESTHPRGFPIPCRSQSPPQALGLRRRLFRRRV